MKILALFIPLLLILVFSCQHEEHHSIETGKVTFSLQEIIRPGGRVSETIIPAFALISFEDNRGRTQENIKLPLFAVDNNYITESIELPTGNYVLTKFIVLDESLNVIYAIPIQGSELAKRVTHPLPINFVVGNVETKITPEVLPVYPDDRAELFGIISFDFKIISQNTKVKKVTIDGISVVDTLNFYYENEKVDRVNWCTQLYNRCIVSDSELRRYGPDGRLDSINGRWNIDYTYEEGLLKRIVAFHDTNYFSTTTFLTYSNGHPASIKIENPSEINYVDLTFNSSGDLVRKTLKDEEGILLEDIEIQYSTIENPLQGLIEPISLSPFAVFDFEGFAFYYSKHVPQIMINPVPALPGHPILQHNISYEYKQDASGKLIAARAFYKDINVHNLLIDYGH